MPDTCILCEHHVWSDSNWFHVCLKGDTSEEQRVDAPACDSWRMDRRGEYNLTDKEAIVDLTALESRSKDDKYTRNK